MSAEPWWVNALSRNPTVLPYTCGQRILDKIYLDTTFATARTIYHKFPTKAAGLQELLQKVSNYPRETVFHFHAWTFGYEEVWTALSCALRSQVRNISSAPYQTLAHIDQIHVDDYKSRLYGALTSSCPDGNHYHDGHAPFGFTFGNRHQPGCLTRGQSVRLHSCELGTDCAALLSSDVVYINPIITRSDTGEVLREMGAGGGGGDLSQVHELDLSDDQAIFMLIQICAKHFDDTKAKSRMIEMLSIVRKSSRKSISLNALHLNAGEDKIPLDKLKHLLPKLVVEHERLEKREGFNSKRTFGGLPLPASELPRNIVRNSHEFFL